MGQLKDNLNILAPRDPTKPNVSRRDIIGGPRQCVTPRNKHYNDLPFRQNAIIKHVSQDARVKSVKSSRKVVFRGEQNKLSRTTVNYSSEKFEAVQLARRLCNAVITPVEIDSRVVHINMIQLDHLMAVSY